MELQARVCKVKLNRLVCFHVPTFLLVYGKEIIGEPFHKFHMRSRWQMQPSSALFLFTLSFIDLAGR